MGWLYMLNQEEQEGHLFSDPVSSWDTHTHTEHWISKWLTNEDLERMWPVSRHYLSIWPERLKKTTKNSIQDLNWAPPEHKPGALPLEPTSSVGKKWSWSIPRGYPGTCIEQEENHEQSLTGYLVICQTTELPVSWIQLWHRLYLCTSTFTVLVAHICARACTGLVGCSRLSITLLKM
jgi:hypothetical protein